MKRSLILSIAATAALFASAAQPVAYPQQTVKYSVTYRWGFINKVAGHGTVVTECATPGQFTGSLTGQSIPWGGKLYTVTDRLEATFGAPGANGVAPETITLKNGIYSKPEVGQTVTDLLSDPAMFWDTDGRGTLDASADTKEAVSITADMLSLFYYAKAIDFPSLSEGQKLEIPITNADGSKGSLAITYGGEQTVNLGSLEVPAYAIVFNYTYNGVPSAYPVNAWISVNGRIPVILSASLAIGHMEMTANF